jgi:hypothetical protein
MILSKTYILQLCREVDFSLHTIGLPRDTDDLEGPVTTMNA